MAHVMPDDVSGIGEFDRGGNVFTRIGAASVSRYCYNYYTNANSIYVA